MIKLNDLAIGYNGEAILEHIDQEFDDGLIYGILAKSGAGKTTLLKTISGLLHPVHGEVVIDGTTYRNADKNPVYMMHQRYSNFGWLSCTENVLIAQRDKKLRSRDDAIKVLAAVGLEQYADKWPSQLSGGMQQRLALARTLYVKPKYLLMDEPLSALDDKTRSKMQRLILDVHAETGNTIVMVTHSQDEAFKMCDKIIKAVQPPKCQWLRKMRRKLSRMLTCSLSPQSITGSRLFRLHGLASPSTLLNPK